MTIEEAVIVVNRAIDGCQNDGICAAQPGGQRFPASGQIESYGPGSDGAVRVGAALSYNGPIRPAGVGAGKYKPEQLVPKHVFQVPSRKSAQLFAMVWLPAMTFREVGTPCLDGKSLIWSKL